jgi:hypothetical protein
VCVYYFLITLGVCMHGFIVYCDWFSYVLLGLCVCMCLERGRERLREERVGGEKSLGWSELD